jgi:fumarate reductase subunit C
MWFELDLFVCGIYALVNEPLFVVGTVAFLESKIVVFLATAAFALQAPLTLIPFLLPTVSFLPIQFHLEAKDIELAAGAGV